MEQLISIHYERNEIEFTRGKFRVKGGTVDIFPAYQETALRISLDSDLIKDIWELDPLTGRKIKELSDVWIYPAKHFVTDEISRLKALKLIEEEMKERVNELNYKGKNLEAQRLEQRTRYDMEMLKEVGFCHGIENYSRHLSGRAPGERPFCLLDYFPKDYLLLIDESHVTIPQIRGMYEGDRSRKQTLVDFGFRLPSALDNRPLKFDEFESLAGQTIFVSATPGPYELTKSKGEVVEQIIRPTGLIDPELTVRPVSEGAEQMLGFVNPTSDVRFTKPHIGQIADFIDEAEKTIKNGGRALATTLTKQMAEDLASFLREKGIKSEYLHSDVKTIDRIDILTKFRKGEFDILVGVNLLREGLDLPEVELVGILDADKEGFLRSETSLIQTIGRAARNVLGRVILYADVMTGSLEKAISETNRRRELQLAYNKKHHITPKTIQKEIRDIAESMRSEHQKTIDELLVLDTIAYKDDPKAFIRQKREEMAEAVEKLDFETAAIIRDEIYKLEGAKGKKPRARK